MNCSPPKCIAYREDGRICGRPATVIDQQRGGMVCQEHAPPAPQGQPPDEQNGGGKR